MQSLIRLGILMTTLLIFSVETLSASVMTFPHYNFNVATADKSPVKLNTHTSLIVTLVPTSKDAPHVSDFKFDAKMPQHKHGMVTSAKTVKISDLVYRVDGVRLHMPGLWVFEFSAQHAVGETKVFSTFDLPAK
jgi:hypothetical protein